MFNVKAFFDDFLIRELRAEVDRLKRGDFTKEEFQNLCHKFSEGEKDLFCRGCEQYQTALFGESPISKLRERINELEAVLSEWIKPCFCKEGAKCLMCITKETLAKKAYAPKRMSDEDLHRFYKNTCSTRNVSFAEFKSNYEKSLDKTLKIIYER